MVDITDIDIQQHKQEEVKCTKHNDKVLEYYCNECKRTACVACCVTSHFQHRCEGLSDVDVNLLNK